MKLDIDPSLPIADRADDIAEALRAHQVVVVAGETGSGKTTQLPKIARALGRERIAHTQPRRIAARSVARRIAEECDVELGREVGYGVRFDDRSTRETTIRLVTDGLLLSEIHHDRELRRYDTVIVDEAHERSLSIDFLIGYLRSLLPRRPDLKVVITSATIDVERFAEAFADAAGPAPIVEVSGRTYPVEIRYRPLEESDSGDLLDGIAAAVDELPRDGDILVFLPGERDIRDATDFLSGKKYPRTEILPLYGRLSASDQHKVFSDHPGRRIVLATNVAETSLTVPGIRYVIDPGLARISRYSQRLKVQRLPIEPISQASAAQRAGRCGRVADGICIRLYSEEDFEGRPEFTDPEIQRTNLASVLLQMAALDLGPMADFGFLDPPDPRAVRDGERLLAELGALDGTRLTRLGRTMSSLPTDPRLARMLLAADRQGCLADVLVIVAALSIQDPRERPLEHQQAADEKHRRFQVEGSDFLSWLELWRYVRDQRNERSSSAFRRMCRDEFLHYLRIREWHDVHAQLRRTAKEDLGLKIGSAGAHPDQIHRALLTGLLSNIGVRESGPEGGRQRSGSREFLGARGAHFMVFPGSGLAKKPPRWIMAAELVETTRLWARTAAGIEPDWIEEAAKHLVVREHSEPHWSSKRGAAMAREKVSLYGIPLVTGRLVPLSRIAPATSRELFIRHALVQGEWRTHHAFWKHNQDLLAQIEDSEDRLRRRDLRVSDDILVDFYDARVPPEVVSVRHFDAWWKAERKRRPRLLDLTEDVLAHQSPEEHDFPSVWTSQSSEYPVTYRFEPGAADDGVTVDLPVHDVMSVDEAQFSWGVPGRRTELVEALIRTLPKHLRRDFVPVPQAAATLSRQLDTAQTDLLEELAHRMRQLNGSAVQSTDFAPAELPDHLRMTFRVVDDGTELARGKDLQALRERVRPRVRADLRSVAKEQERTGLRTWDVGEIEDSITVGQATGYPALVDEADAVALRVLDDPIERDVAMVRGQGRLLSFVVPSPVPGIGRALDLRTKLLLSTGPYRDAAALIEDCFLAALDHLVVVHGGPVRNPSAFESLRERVRADAYDVTERAVQSAGQVLSRLGDVSPDGSPAGEDVRVQLSWLVYPGFVRDTGLDRLPRVPLYLQAAARLIERGDDPHLPEVQELDAEFHRRIGSMSPLRRQAPDVLEVRWALEELRISLFAQNLRADRPVSVKRVRALLSRLPAGR